MMGRFLVGALGVLLFVGNAGAGDKDKDKVFQTLHCDFYDPIDEEPLYAIEADMTDFDQFTPYGYRLFRGAKDKKTLTQKKPQGKELFRFVLGKERPKYAVLIRVFDSKKGLWSTSSDPSIQDDIPDRGTCYFK